MVRPPLEPGTVIWTEMGSGVGREQSGRRPAVVVSSFEHLRAADQLLTVIPCTSRDREWPNHIEMSGPTNLPTASFAMTEQVRTISRDRVVGTAGEVDGHCLASMTAWLHRWLA